MDRGTGRLRANRLRFSLPLLLVGCGGTTDIITPPPPPPAGFTLTLVPDPEDVAAAQALGWQAGIPGLTVTMTPTDSSRPPRGFTSAAGGVVSIPDLLPGDYIVEASRWLTAAERTRLPAADDANGFVARTVVRSSGSGAERVSVPASRQKGLVISEWAFNGYYVPGQALYQLGGFLELTNNADTTVYLDGLTLAAGFDLDIDVPISPCAANLQFTQDPEGVWSRFLNRFPGTGRQYPLAPGGVTVIATDAIDHRALIPGGIDLSHANFEFSGPADVDNPSAPNLIDIGLVSYSEGHGFYWQTSGSAVAILALPLAVGDLERRHHAGSADYVRVPRAKVLDGLWVRTNYLAEYQECPRLVSTTIDRAGSNARSTDEAAEWNYSLSRRRAPTGGTKLQHTRSGFVDFVRTARNPGVVLNP